MTLTADGGQTAVLLAKLILRRVEESAAAAATDAHSPAPSPTDPASTEAKD